MSTLRSVEIQEDVTCSNTLADCTPIDLNQHSSFEVKTGGSLNNTSLTVYTSPSETGTYTALTASDATAATLAISASKSVAAPLSVFSAAWVKLVGNSGSDDLTVIKKG